MTQFNVSTYRTIYKKFQFLVIRKARQTGRGFEQSPALNGPPRSSSTGGRRSSSSRKSPEDRVRSDHPRRGVTHERNSRSGQTGMELRSPGKGTQRGFAEIPKNIDRGLTRPGNRDPVQVFDAGIEYSIAGLDANAMPLQSNTSSSRMKAGRSITNSRTTSRHSPTQPLTGMHL